MSVAALKKLGRCRGVENGARARPASQTTRTRGGATVVADRRQSSDGADGPIAGANAGRSPTAGRGDLDLVHDGLVIIGTPIRGAPQSAQDLPRGATLFAMELIPWITCAQSMDVLSSTATIAGYKAVLLAADRCPRCSR